MGAQMPELVVLLGRDNLTRGFATAFRLAAMVAELPGRAFAAASP